MTQMSADASRGVPIRRQPTRVLYLDHVAAPSGAEFALVRLLADLDPDLVTPTVVFASDGPMVERVRALDVDTHVLPLASAVRDVRKDAVGRAMLLRAATAGVGLGAYVRRIARFARERHIDLIHTNSMKAHLYGGLAGRLAGVPVVWHLRDYVDPTYLPPTTVRGVRAAARVLPSGVVAVSGSVLERLRLPARVAGRVVHDGLTTEELRPRRRGGGRAAWPTPARIGMVGRISAWKGQHVLLDAAAQILAAGHDARFVVVGAPLFGEEDYAASLQDQARRLGIADRVDFVGFRSNVDATLSELDVLVHASTSPDPFPNTVLEGMAAGLPLVASRGGGVTEMIEHGVSGRLAEMGSGDSLAEELDAVLTNFAGARRMGDAAYGRVREQFTGVRTARAVEAFYETVLSTAPPRGNAVPLRPAAVKAGRRQLRCHLV